MAVKTILKMGAPLLHQVAKPVDLSNLDTIAPLINDMHETMIALGGVGISAPQIGTSLRIMIFGFEQNERYPGEASIPMTVLLNPSFEIVDDSKQYGWEGCLSVPGIRGYVPRVNGILYQGFDLNGNDVSRSVSGFHARVFQHEFDHLDGYLFVQRIEDMTKIGYTDELILANRIDYGTSK